jgi:hypothetical protein
MHRWYETGAAPAFRLRAGLGRPAMSMSTRDRPGAVPQPTGGRTFAELYCRRHGIELERYLPVVLHRTLPPLARPWISLIEWLRPEHLAGDYLFIIDVGRSRSYADYEEAVREFHRHGSNRGLWRGLLRLRVSAQRMRSLVREVYVRTEYVYVQIGGDDVAPAIPFIAAEQETPPTAGSAETRTEAG